MENIYLIGMMGAGKTTTGEALAALAAGVNFVDIDQKIQDQTKLSINEIFEKRGEEFFRQQEKQILVEISRQSNLVVATSGGIVLTRENVERMKETGEIVYLSASPGTLWERVQDKKDRPLLQTDDPAAILHGLYRQRLPLYESAATVTINTDHRTPEEVAEEIFRRYFK